MKLGNKTRQNLKQHAKWYRAHVQLNESRNVLASMCPTCKDESGPMCPCKKGREAKAILEYWNKLTEPPKQKQEVIMPPKPENKIILPGPGSDV